MVFRNDVREHSGYREHSFGVSQQDDHLSFGSNVGIEVAQRAAKKLPVKPDNDTLLELYSYFKQATQGDLSGTRPGAFDFVARAKYDAWLARKGVKKDAAMRAYIKLVEHLQSL